MSIAFIQLKLNISKKCLSICDDTFNNILNSFIYYLYYNLQYDHCVLNVMNKVKIMKLLLNSI